MFRRCWRDLQVPQARLESTGKANRQSALSRGDTYSFQHINMALSLSITESRQHVGLKQQACADTSSLIKKAQISPRLGTEASRGRQGRHPAATADRGHVSTAAFARAHFADFFKPTIDMRISRSLSIPPPSSNVQSCGVIRFVAPVIVSCHHGWRHQGQHE